MSVSPTQARIARANDAGLAYQVFGAGPPPVLLPGGFGSVGTFGTNLDLLAAVTTNLGLAPAALMGFWLGGAVARRTAIQHPELVERLVLVSAAFKRSGWHSGMTAEMAEGLKQSPMHEIYEKVAPRKEDWPVLVAQVTRALKLDYDWPPELGRLTMPVMIVAGDADGRPPSHAVEFFGRLGGGQHDASWDRSGMTKHRLAALPGLTHYDINESPSLALAVVPFLNGE